MAANDSHFDFFGLPHELHTKIYEYLLIEDTPIIVTSAFKPPNLIITCRQLRKEAINIFYKRNKFIITVINCDSSVHRAFLTRMRKGGYRIRYKNRFRFNNPNPDVVSIWMNLKAHCRAVWENPRMKFILPTRAQSSHTMYRRYFAVMECAQHLTFRAKRHAISWQEYEEQMEQFRDVAGSAHASWRI